MNIITILFSFFLLKEYNGNYVDVILGFIGMGLVGYFIFGYPMAWVYAFISKITNRNINYRGKNLTNPQDFDLMVDHTKKQLDQVKDGISRVGKVGLDKKVDNSLNKIEKLERAASLYKNGLISKDEFDKLKSELL